MRSNIKYLRCFSCLAGLFIFSALSGIPKSSVACAFRTPDDKPTVENHSEGNALRVSVVNAIVNYVNNAREATLDVRWELLPETKELFTMAAGEAPIRLTIRNSDLTSAALWTAQIPNNESRKVLAHVLGLRNDEDLSAFSPNSAEDAYEEAIKQNANFLTSDEMVTALNDHYFLRFILSTSGVGFTVRSDDAAIQGGERRFDREIRWKISLYHVRTIQRFELYRVSLWSELGHPETLVFPGTTQTKATLGIAASFKPSPNTIGVQTHFSFDPQIVNLPQVQPTPLSGDQTKLGGTAVEGILKFVGNVDFEEVVAHNLFSGTTRASIYYGGLVGQGKVQQLVGVNQMLGPQSGNLALGVLMGVAPGSNNSLFLGPSLRSDTITAGVGGIALQRSTGAGSDTKIGIYPAATLALDLSKLVGGRKDTQTIRLDKSIIGGRGSDELAKQVYALSVVIKPDATVNQQDMTALKMKPSYLQWKRKQKYTTEGAAVPATDPSDQAIIRTFVPSVGIVYAPRGEYELDSINLPDGFEILNIVGKPFDKTKLVGAGRPGQSTPIPLVLTVHKKP